ncbi:outer membrane protein [Ruminobacter sp. RM87]|uniref:outer membrane protein n=1 Tax=Ruminobacter sp. RM87 TaxID=1200567 RepID=UPI0012F9FFF8|nr:outer membrane beta-barrel protein [Ruminobacter sp. RM87]
MKNMLLKVVPCAVLLAAGASAYAADGYQDDTSARGFRIRPYIGGTAGVAFTNLDYTHDDHHHHDNHEHNVDDGASFIVNPHVGLDFEHSSGMGFKVEAEGFFLNNDDYSMDVWGDDHTVYRDTMTVKSSGMFVNVIGNYHINSVVVPYVGTGLGFARNRSSISGFTEHNTELAINVKAGTELMLNDHFGFDVGLRYADYGEVSKDYFYEKLQLDSFDLYAGFNLKF